MMYVICVGRRLLFVHLQQ